MNRDRLGQAGMTLVEVLAVIVLIALIMGVVAKGIFGKGDEAKARLNVVKMENVQQALESYRLDFSKYPNSLNELITPSADVKQSGKLFIAKAKEDDLKDIWGFPYSYSAQNNGQSYTLKSLGSDGIEGGEGAKQDVVKRP